MKNRIRTNRFAAVLVVWAIADHNSIGVFTSLLWVYVVLFYVGVLT